MVSPTPTCECGRYQLSSAVFNDVIFRIHGTLVLLKCKGITTIGHLSALTEREVNKLRIGSPKVGCVRNALSAFARANGIDVACEFLKLS